MREGKFSVSLNQRYSEGLLSSAESVQARAKYQIQQLLANDFNKIAYGLFNRGHLFSGSDFAAFTSDVETNGNAGNFVIGAYLTVGGTTTGEGVVLRVPGALDGASTESARIGEDNAFPCHQGFCLQTNSDSENDLGGSEIWRYKGGVEHMDQAMGDLYGADSTLTAQQMWGDVLSQCPTQVNRDSSVLTIYTATMVAATGGYDAKVMIPPDTGSPVVGSADPDSDLEDGSATGVGGDDQAGSNSKAGSTGSGIIISPAVFGSFLLLSWFLIRSSIN